MVVFALTAGSAVLMWMGERITENGVGNGISIVLVINIISRLPEDLNSLFQQFIAGKTIPKAILAAVIIAEVVFGKVFRNFSAKLLGCVLGAVIYYIVIQIVLKMGLSTDDLKLLSALVVAVFLALPYWKSKYFSKVGKQGE